jgi:hypothetical protein
LDYAACISSLAYIYADTEPLSAFELYKEAAQIQKEIAGEDDPDYTIILSNVVY